MTDKIMPRLSIEVDQQVVASVFKGNLTMKPAARQFLTDEQEQQCIDAAMSGM